MVPVAMTTTVPAVPTAMIMGMIAMLIVIPVIVVPIVITTFIVEPDSIVESRSIPPIFIIFDINRCVGLST